MNFNIHEAKDNLPHLIQQVEAGEDIVIMREGKPVARLMPYAPSEQKKEPRKLGTLKGKIEISDDFYEPDNWFDSK